MNRFDALALAHAALERAVTGVTAWDAPSPCEGWTAWDVAQHVVGGAVRYRMLLEGASSDDLAPTRTADHLGDDPLAATRRTSAALEQAFREPGALERVVHHPAGDRSGEALLVMRVLEAALHAWDVARSVGADETLDEGLCAWLLPRAEAVEELRGLGSYEPARTAGGDSPQARLLALAGRGEQKP